MTDQPDDQRPIGGILDGLGIKATIEPDALVSDAVVILKTLLPNGNTRLSVAFSQGLGWIERAGMLHLAHAIETDRAAEGRERGA